MSRTAQSHLHSDLVTYARSVLSAEAQALESVAVRLDGSFGQVAQFLLDRNGRIAVSGVGKSADVGRKLVGTFNSTGSRSYFLDATGALHGDLGMLHPDDVVLLLSHSGESDEIRRLLPPLQELGPILLAITGTAVGMLAQRADAAIVYGPLIEACPLSLAPSSSTTIMMALGDALAFSLSRERGLTAEQFARFHPAGSLGRKLANVEAYMRCGAALRTAPAESTVRSVFTTASRRGRRTGAILLLDSAGRLCGLFTDSDLARLFERRGDESFDRPIREVMSRDPWTVAEGSRLTEALEIMRAHKISELPVVDRDGKPVGLLDITDLLELVPASDLMLEWDDSASPVRIRRSA